jgi:hypothetical protein
MPVQAQRGGGGGGGQHSPPPHYSRGRPGTHTDKRVQQFYMLNSTCMNLKLGLAHQNTYGWCAG